MVDRSFTTLLSEISPNVPGCPQPLMLSHIRKAAIKVCERTLLWRYTQPIFALSPGIHEYIYNKPANADVHVVFAAYVNDAPLEILTLEQAILNYPKWADLYSGESVETLWSLTPPSTFGSQQFNTAPFNAQPEFVYPDAVLADASQPLSICQLTPNKYIVLPLPDNAQPYNMRMFYALRPALTSEGMESAVLDELQSAIVHMALQELLVMPNVTWTDRALATYHARQGLFETTERRARANLSNMRGLVAARFPKFA